MLWSLDLPVDKIMIYPPLDRSLITTHTPKKILTNSLIKKLFYYLYTADLDPSSNKNKKDLKRRSFFIREDLQ
jgi:hypothetical protein